MRSEKVEELQQRRLMWFQEFLHQSSYSLLLSEPTLEGGIVVDLGCGDGAITMLLSTLVGEHGIVYAIDHDLRKIELLKQRAAGIENIHPICGDAFASLAYIKKADVVYARCFFMHLKERFDLLERIWISIRNGGTLIAEEPVIDATFDFPSISLWSAALGCYAKYCSVKGIEPNYGRLIIEDLKLIGWKMRLATQTQTIIEPVAAKKYIECALMSSKDAYLNSGVLSEKEYSLVLSGVRMADMSKVRMCGFHPLMQVRAFKECA